MCAFPRLPSRVPAHYETGRQCYQHGNGMVDLTMRSSSLPCFLLVLLISFQTSVIESNVHDVCGFPGLPSNGSLDSTTSLLFSAGQQVTYKCQEAFVLFGPDKRICQGNGSWSPVSLPECRENVAVGKSSLQSSTLWNYHPDLAVDANPDTCSFTPRSGEQRWWQVHLGGDGINVQSVAITLSPGSYQKFTIFIIQLLEGNKAMYKPCSKFDGKFETKKAVFLCNDGLGHPGQFVYIRDDRKSKSTLAYVKLRSSNIATRQCAGTQNSHFTAQFKDCLTRVLSMPASKVTRWKRAIRGETASTVCGRAHLLHAVQKYYARTP